MSSLSEEEFVRMQTQLLELRASNYELGSKCQSQEKELVSLREQVANLDKELTKSTKTLNKSKKAKEFEQLALENDLFQRKLAAQEEEFRLQNITLLEELQRLVTANETLEKENCGLRKKDGFSVSDKPDSNAVNSLQDESRRLQAQNSVLQKNLTVCQEQHSQEVGGLRQRITDLEAQCVKLSGQRVTPLGGGSESRFIEGMSDAPDLVDDLAEGDLAGGDLMHPLSESYQPPVSDLPAVNLGESTLHKQVDSLTKELSDLRLASDTEKEENLMLKAQLQNLELNHQNKMQELQGEITKLSDKFKKKQESLVQLQEEKEKLYSQLQSRIEDIQTTKEREMQALHEDTNKLKEDLNTSSKAFEDYEVQSQSRIGQLESLINTMEGRMEEASLETNAQLSTANQQLQDQMQRTQEQVQRMQEKLNMSRREGDELRAQLQEGKSSLGEATDRIISLQAERDQLTCSLQEANRLAEKRKSLLDELAIKYQEEADQHRELTKSCEEKHRTETEELSGHIDELQLKLNSLEPVRDMLDKVKGDLHSVETAKSWLERRLDEAEEHLAQLKAESEEELNKVKVIQEQDIVALKEEHTVQLQHVDAEKTKICDEKGELEEVIGKLKQEILDQEADKKLTQKKGSTVLKDLKRQLQAERKRGEKLQERLQELLSDTRSRQSVEELFRPADPERYRGDNSSVGSWCANTSGLSRDMSGLSPDEDGQSGNAFLEQENSELMRRLGEVQQQTWTLEEKVLHLESSNSAMAEDLLTKTSIIEHYVMESKGDHMTMSPSNDRLTLKRVVDFVKDKGDENLREINRKLQRMLEETLTKNMHLQENMETLSHELVRVSGQSTDSSQPTTTEQ